MSKKTHLEENAYVGKHFYRGNMKQLTLADRYMVKERSIEGNSFNDFITMLLK